MIADIVIIDCLEKLREFLLSLDPNLAGKLDENSEDPLLFLKKSALLEHYIGARLKIDLFIPAGRRKCRNILNELEAEFGQQDDVKWKAGEQTEVVYARLSSKRRKELWRGLEKIQKWFHSGELENALKSGAQRAAQLLWSGKIGLGGIGAYHYLHSLGAQTLIPDSSRRTFLYRLGWIEDRKKSATSLKNIQELGERMSQLAGDSIRSLNHLAGLFSGAVSHSSEELPVCSRNPKCSICTLSAQCMYSRYREKKSRETAQSLPIREWTLSQQPREKLLNSGASTLSDTELLAIIMRTGSGKSSALDLAAKLLQEFGSLRALEQASVTEMCGISGIGKVKALSVKAGLEMGKRFTVEFDSEENETPFSSSDIVFQNFRLRFTGIQHETFYMLILNSRNILIRETEISKGSLTSCTVHPREVFKEAIRHSASGVIFLHNHPSGDPSPSRTDVSLTERLKKAGDLLGIRVLDHIIIGRNRFFSFADEGMV